MCSWSSTWSNPAPVPPQSNPKPSSPLSAWDDKPRDEVLVEWQRLQKLLASAKDAEMEFRKYVVSRAFPNPTEGTNTLELNNGYSLKAGIKYNYKLADNKTVEGCLDNITKIGNQGAFIADRLVSWTPNFLLTEYRELQKNAEGGSDEAKKILAEVNKMLTIDQAAPTLEIKEPKGKKK